MQESRQEIMTKSGKTNKLNAASHNGLEPALGHSALNTTQIQKVAYPYPWPTNPLQVQVNNMTWKNERDNDQDKGKWG
jgi:hypothetical protein